MVKNPVSNNFSLHLTNEFLKRKLTSALFIGRYNLATKRFDDRNPYKSALNDAIVLQRRNWHCLISSFSLIPARFFQRKSYFLSSYLHWRLDIIPLEIVQFKAECEELSSFPHLLLKGWQWNYFALNKWWGQRNSIYISLFVLNLSF